VSVPSPAPTRHGPLEGFATKFATVRSRTSGAVELEAIPFLAQVDLRADPTDAALVDRLGSALGVPLPLARNTASSDANGSRRVLWLSPDEWLILAPDGSAAAIEASLRAALDGSRAAVVDVSANRAILRLAGPAAREILEGGCSIDLHPRAFGPGRCAQTILARAPLAILQVSTEPDYRLLVRSSFAAYLANWLLDAIDGLG
jgi:sarcosine oxidase subunit gamma